MFINIAYQKLLDRATKLKSVIEFNGAGGVQNQETFSIVFISVNYTEFLNDYI